MRLKALSVALALGLLAPGAHAGLGEVRVLSAAGEPFLAEIPLVDEPGLAAPYASLASAQQYPFLESFSAKAFQLKIVTLEEHPGQYVVRVMGPVMAPEEVLDFALELAWASGREVRAYHAEAHVPQGGVAGAASAVASQASAHETSAPSANYLAFGEAHLLSSSGMPLLAEIALQGQWPAGLQDDDFVIRLGKGLEGDRVSIHYHQAGGHQWLTLQGQQLIVGPDLKFALGTHANGLLVERSFHLTLANAAARTKAATELPKPALGTRYQVRAGDTLSGIVSSLAGGRLRRNELALQLVHDNPHAFVNGDPNKLLAGAWLRLPPHVPTRPSVTVVTSSKTAVKAEPVHAVDASASAGEHAKQEADRQRIQHLHQAQQRIAQLEAEIRRIAAMDREPAKQPKVLASSPAEVARKDEDLLAALDDWVLTGIGGASVMSLLAWAVWHRRKRQLRESLTAKPTKWTPEAPDVAKDVPETRMSPALGNDAIASEAAAGESLALNIDAPVPVQVESLPETETAVVEQAQPMSAADVLAEVDVLLVYGRREQAEQLLRTALRQEPQAEAIRYKLLQLLAQTGATEPFEAEALDVLAMTGPEGGLWQRVQQLGASFDGGNPLYRSAVVEELPVVTPPAAEEAIRQPVREPVRQVVRKVSGNEMVPPSALADNDDEAAALARLYREMGDSEMADALLKGDGG
ncbi:type IV pilus assembly protein FimV [Vogesella oryzae]|uniref:type IV pilus assembly protein FimV n=1 Tax=Vogesella oryzae TaxID=1735285 RepID=UPI001C2E3D52|nr:hypothetical protein [Vogesella oryzae]